MESLRGKAAKVGMDRDRLPTTPKPSINPNKASFLALIDEARIRAGETIKEMAGNAGTDTGSFSEAMSGQGRINFAAHWLDGQSDAWWMAFIKIVCEKRGLDATRQREITAERIGELVCLLIKQTEVAP